jgi:hypothetical protein
VTFEGLSDTFKGHMSDFWYFTTLNTIENNIFGTIASPQNPQKPFRLPVITTHNYARPFIGLLMIL